MPQYCVGKLVSFKRGGLCRLRNADCPLGLAYKPEVGDLRESPSLEIETILKGMGADLTVYDPLLPAAKSLKKP